MSKFQNNDFFIHPLSEVQTENIGVQTRIWQHSIVMKDVIIGKNCNISCHTFLEDNVIIGNNVTIKSGVFLWDGMRIQDNVFIGPNVTFTNDKYPRSKSYPEKYQSILLKKGASIGANSTILGGVIIGENAMIGAASLVTKNIPDGELWFGSPAKFIRKI